MNEPETRRRLKHRGSASLPFKESPPGEDRGRIMVPVLRALGHFCATLGIVLETKDGGIP